jgi:mitogen-activated protein kinase kinase kinase 1
MLRVFQLSENDPCLWSKTLKNYEVEALFRNFHARRTSLIENLRKKKVRKSPPPKEETDQDQPSTEDCKKTQQVEHEEEEEEEEDSCPICLLEMVEGESVTECVLGCQNKFHHHCIAIWFEECGRQNEPLICPLCRATWKVEPAGSDATSGEELPAPPNTRVSSPQNVPQEADLLLPRAEPIPPEHSDTARPWIPVLGEDLVACLFSKNWVVREVALKQLGQVAIGALLLGVGEGRSGVLLSPSRQATTHSMLECCLSVLAFICADPVYKVFVAGLRALRIVLAYTPCRDEIQQTRLQTLMKPVIDTILWKCADSNKRTSQLSISALQELVKGQDGELAVGKEIVNPGNRGIGGLSYLIECSTELYDPSQVQWQWLLGRCYMLMRLLDEFPRDFTTRPPCGAGVEMSSLEELMHYDRVMRVLSFTRMALDNSHQKVGKMARRLFYYTAKLQAHNSSMMKKITDMLDGLEINLQVHLKRNLLKVAAEFQVEKRVVDMMQRGEGSINAESFDDSEPLPLYPTPIVSEASTPRSTSPSPPSPQPQIKVTVNNFVQGNLNFVPKVPPNSPERRLKSTSENSEGSDGYDLTLMAALQRCSPEGTAEKTLVGIQPVLAAKEPLNCPNVFQEKELLLNPGITCQNCGAPHDYKPTSTVDACVCTSPSLHARRIQLDLSAIEENEDEEPSPVKPRPFSFISEASYEDTTSQDELDESRPSSPATDAFSVSASSADATAATSSGNLTEELMDITLSPSRDEDNVSFKTEVASTSPQHLSYRLPRTDHRHSDEESCPCKEEVEKEEAQALVAAMEQSSLQQNELPYVPGLSRQDEEQTLTIHIQEDTEEISESLSPNESHPEHRYLEGVDWVRGPMLGTGAFSTCYQARDNRTGTLMAVKQISYCRNSLSEQEKVIEAVSEEIQMMSRLNHPHVVRILGATRQGCHFFMFVEWMPGGSVAYMLDRYGKFTEPVLISYTQQVLRGLAYLHDNQVLHRDLKGANLLVDSTGQRLRIGDFGAAARLASRTTMAGEFQGQLLGTIAFMAPEVLRGENYGRSCDVWSVGCSMIEMTTTKPPWGASDVSNHLALIFKIASCVEPPPIPDNLSPAVRDLLLRCLEVNREDRPPARELLKHPLFTMYSKR